MKHIPCMGKTRAGLRPGPVRGRGCLWKGKVGGGGGSPSPAHARYVS